MRVQKSDLGNELSLPLAREARLQECEAHWRPCKLRLEKAAQQPLYDDQRERHEAISRLEALPPLVRVCDIEALKKGIALAAMGRAFVLQGGACAETFADSNSETVGRTTRLLRQMSLILKIGLARPVIQVGRIAGQYAKPRSADIETIEGLSLPSYRGDMVNSPEFSAEARRPDPQRLIEAYWRAAAVLYFCRMDDVDFEDKPDAVVPIWRERRPQSCRRRSAGIFTCHEGLHLDYERALTRQDSGGFVKYNLSTHLPWIGMRTADPNGAHVEYFSRIKNPIAIKLGPQMTPDCLSELLDRLHPDDEPGRLMLIHRFGNDQIRSCLPPLIDTVRRSGKTVLWCCDPMHGNTVATARGFRTRRFDVVFSEIRRAFAIHNAMGALLGGIHLEMTGDSVTECVGGSCGLTENDLGRAYESTVDPRLNPEQALELVTRIVLSRR